MERKYNFYNVAYEYCKEDYPAMYHTLDELTGKCPLIHLPEDGADPIGTFKELRNGLNADFLDILKIFSLEDFFNAFKEDGNYLFTEQDVAFLAALLHHSRQKYVWKKDIKHILNYPLDKRNFILICQASKEPNEFAEEVNFAARGFLAMYQSLDTVSESSKKAFQKQLIISSQYPTLNLRNQCEQIAQDICALYPTDENVSQSINGILLLDYADLLDQTLDRLKQCVSESQDTMKQLETKRREEFNQLLKSNLVKQEMINDTHERIVAYVRKKYPGYSLNQDFDIVPENATAAQCKQRRKDACEVKQTLEEAFTIEIQNHPVEFTNFAKHFHII